MEHYDQIVYDVLGDVVCGGFAVPGPQTVCQCRFLVTSGESMAIYAANNILCGIKNLNPNGSQIAGIIYNSRGVGDESKRVEDFAQAVHLPILARIPRSSSFAQAEKEAMTLVEKDPDSTEAKIFLELAREAFKPAQALSCSAIIRRADGIIYARRHPFPGHSTCPGKEACSCDSPNTSAAFRNQEAGTV